MKPPFTHEDLKQIKEKQTEYVKSLLIDIIQNGSATPELQQKLDAAHAFDQHLGELTLIYQIEEHVERAKAFNAQMALADGPGAFATKKPFDA